MDALCSLPKECMYEQVYGEKKKVNLLPCLLFILERDFAALGTRHGTSVIARCSRTAMTAFFNIVTILFFRRLMQTAKTLVIAFLQVVFLVFVFLVIALVVVTFRPPTPAATSALLTATTTPSFVLIIVMACPIGPVTPRRGGASSQGDRSSSTAATSGERRGCNGTIARSIPPAALDTLGAWGCSVCFIHLRVWNKGRTERNKRRRNKEDVLRMFPVFASRRSS